MTQATLASRTGLLRTTVTNIERGHQAVLVHQLVEIANVLGASVSDLLSTAVATLNAPEGNVVPDQIQALLGKLDSGGRRGRAT